MRSHDAGRSPPERWARRSCDPLTRAGGPRCPEYHRVLVPLTRLDLRGVAADELAAALPRPAVEVSFPSDAVRAVLDEVRAGGDEAVRALTRRFDGVEIDTLRVPREDLDEALETLDPVLRAALELAYARILAYHGHEPAPVPDFENDGVVVRHLVRPVARAGLYAPGGRARYPSTVLMCAAPARVAGVAELVLCVPPGPDGSVATETLAAAAIAGIDEVYRVGGAQAIAAMAFGTESIRPVDVIAGPGNRYVAEAKRQVSGIVGVPSAFAGPSEVVVVADDATPVAWAAIDVVVQAEHGPDGLAWLVTWSPRGRRRHRRRGGPAGGELARAGPTSRPPWAAADTSRWWTGRRRPSTSPTWSPPSTWSCSSTNAVDLLPLVRSAGAVFLGPYAPASVGDYLAGPNHVLPTARTARFASALRVDDFRTHIHAVSMDAATLARLAPARGRHRAGRGAPGPRPIRHRARRAVTGGPVPLRPDLTVLSGYHSPQVEVEVRLNTNESPLPPPPEWLEELRDELGPHRLQPLPRPRRHRAAGRAGRVPPDRPGPGVLCQRVERGPAVPSARLRGPGTGGGAVRADLRAAQPHRLGHRHHRGAGVAGPGSPPRPRGARPGHRRGPTRDHVLVLTQQPHRTRRVTRGRGPCPRAGPGAGGRGRGLRPVLPVERARPHARRRSAGVERLVVVRTFSKTWSMAACRLGYLVADPAVVEACEAVVLPYHLDAMTQAAGRLALRHVDAMEARVALITEERGRIASALAELALESWPSDANFILFRPDARAATDVWQDLVGASVLVRDCSSWPGLDNCLRVTVGTPEENDRFLAALRASLDSSSA